MINVIEFLTTTLCRLSFYFISILIPLWNYCDVRSEWLSDNIKYIYVSDSGFSCAKFQISNNLLLYFKAQFCKGNGISLLRIVQQTYRVHSYTPYNTIHVKHILHFRLSNCINSLNLHSPSAISLIKPSN